MTEKIVDLDAIIADKLSHTAIPPYMKVLIGLAMHEACRQVLKLAAENARAIGPYSMVLSINKQKILDTINQVK